MENGKEYEKLVDKEYKRIYDIFSEADDKQLELIDGMIWECARLRVELDSLYLTIKMTGLIKVNPTNPLQQKELPVAKLIIKARANYLNYIAKLSSILGVNYDDDSDELEEYE